MTVAELIEKLNKLPPTCRVVIAYDQGIRMDVEVAKPAKCYDNGSEFVVVVTDEDEWESRENW